MSVHSFSLDIVISPSHFNFISAEALRESALTERHALTAIAEVLEQASVGNHGAIVDAVAIVHSADRTSPFGRHRAHHLLQTHVAAHTSHQ